MTPSDGATLSDIATQLGLSISTVSRALQDHPGLSSRTKANVLATATALGYRPNLAARALVSRRTLRIGVVTPHEIVSVYDLVRSGIRDEAAPFFAMGVELVDFTFPRLGEGDVAIFERALDEKVDGIIVVPGAPAAQKASFKRAARMKVPIICLLSDAPGSVKLSTVSINAISCGALAGELLGRMIQGKASVAVTMGDRKVTDHQQKFDAFKEAFQTRRADTRIYAPLENHETASEAYEKTLAFLRQHPQLNGLYISTGNGAPALRAVEDAGLLNRLTIFSTNLFREVIPRLRDGSVCGTFYERPYRHGQIAFRLLYDYLSAGVLPPPRITLEPFLITRSNVDCFVSRKQNAGVSGVDEEVVDSVLLDEKLSGSL